MSVRKDKRNQSKMDFFKYADRINEQVTRWLLTNFGEKKIKSDINHIIKDISMEDQKQITDIFNKYDIQSKYILKVEYPEWYITHLRECIFKIISDLCSNITHANSIYSTTLEEANTRRLYQDEAIANCYDLLHQMQNAVMIMQSYHISTNLAIKIYNQYGEGTEDILKNNPYKMVEDVAGIGFFTADKIAISMGVPADSDFRVRAGILHILRENSDKNGNTYMQKSALIEGVYTLLNIPNLESRIDSIINKLIMDDYLKKLDINGEAICLSQYYKIEKVLADSLILLNADTDKLALDISDEIKMYEDVNHISMHEHQKLAVQLAINNGVSVITGGPGTGKTTIIKCILQIFRKKHNKL